MHMTESVLLASARMSQLATTSMGPGFLHATTAEIAANEAMAMP
jgi:hypothetical protein